MAHEASPGRAALDDLLKVRIDRATRERFQHRVQAEHRTESQQIRLLIERYLADTEQRVAA